MQFYCVKTKTRVEVEDSKCTKTRHPLAGGRCSYMVSAVDANGNKLNKILSKAAYDALKCKEGK